MATTTPNFGWPVPTSTDLVKDGATAIEALGDSIDTSLLDLKGGAINQVLTKNSATDMDFTWTTPATSVSPATNFRSGQLYSASGTRTNGTGALNITYYLPIVVPNSVTFDRISCTTSTTFAGTGVVRLGIYNTDGTGLPSTVLLDAGTVSCTATSTNYAITISQAMTPGIYYLAACIQTSATTNGFVGQSALYAPAMPVTNTSPTGISLFGYSQSGVTGAFATAATNGTISTIANITPYVRVA